MIPVGPVTLSAAQWLIGGWLLARTPAPRQGPTRSGRVSVIIPARNEAASLPILLGSLAGQTTPAAEVIVVDDGSTDATASVAAAAGARVVAAPSPPTGWLGKPTACTAGVRAADGDLLVFLDADVVLAPGALEALTGEHARRGGLVSVQPHHRARRWYEKLSAAGNAVTMMGTGAFTGPPGRPPRVAFGPCIITDRPSYEASGGHRHPTVRNQIMEDTALARRYRAEGRPVSVLAGRDLVGFRMHPEGPRQFIDGWTRTLVAGARLGRPWAAAGAFVWVWGALLAGWHLLSLAWERPHVAVWVSVYATWAVAAGWMWRRVGTFGLLTAVAFPIPVAVLALLSVRSLVVAAIGRGTPWRGRRVDNR